MDDDINYRGFTTRGTDIDEAYLNEFEFDDDVDDILEDDYTENDYE